MSHKEQRQEKGRKQREADALVQQEKIQKRKEKKERRQSLAAAVPAPKLSHEACIDPDAQPLFPDQQTDSKVSCCTAALPFIVKQILKQKNTSTAHTAHWCTSQKVASSEWLQFM